MAKGRRGKGKGKHPNHGKRSSGLVRFVDRYAGIPLLGVLRMVRPLTRPLSRKDVRDDNGALRVGIVKVSALGDTVLMEPAIASLLRDGYCVTLYLGSSNYTFAEIIFARYKHNRGNSGGTLHTERLSKGLLMGLALGRHKEQMVFDFGQWTRIEGVVAMLIRSRRRYGFRTPRQYKHLAFDECLNHDPYKHEMDHYLDLIAMAGVAPLRRYPIIPMPAPLSLPPSVCSAYVVFSMFSGTYNGYMREWMPSRWVSLAMLLQKSELSVIVIGTVDDLSGRAYSEFCHRASELDLAFSDLVGKSTLSEMMDVLAGSSLVVSVDTGTAHIAAAMGKRVVAMHGASYIERWGAIGSDGTNIALIQANTPCIGCSSIGSDYTCSDPVCMATISVDHVFDEVCRLLQLIPVKISGWEES